MNESAQSRLLLKVIQSGCLDLEGWNLDLNIAEPSCHDRAQLKV